MPLPLNFEALLASPVKAIYPLVVDDPVKNVVNTAVVSPHLNADREDETNIGDEPPSVSITKIVKNDIISDNPAKYSSSGYDVVLAFLNILGYNACMSHGKKTPFIEKINAQLYADNGPLVR